MFTVQTTAGLNTAAPTPEAVAATLGQHLRDMATDEPIKWWIQTPAGTTHGGHGDLHGKRDNAFIAETIQQVAANLAHELCAGHAATSLTADGAIIAPTFRRSSVGRQQKTNASPLHSSYYM